MFMWVVLLLLILGLAGLDRKLARTKPRPSPWA